MRSGRLHANCRETDEGARSVPASAAGGWLHEAGPPAPRGAWSPPFHLLLGFQAQSEARIFF